MIKIKAHFDGKVIVPDEPIFDIPKDTPLLLEIALAEKPKPNAPRIPGLQQGSILYMADDFDAPMKLVPDEVFRSDKK